MAQAAVAVIALALVVLAAGPAAARDRFLPERDLAGASRHLLGASASGTADASGSGAYNKALTGTDAITKKTPGGQVAADGSYAADASVNKNGQVSLSDSISIGEASEFGNQASASGSSHTASSGPPGAKTSTTANAAVNGNGNSADVHTAAGSHSGHPTDAYSTTQTQAHSHHG